MLIARSCAVINPLVVHSGAGAEFSCEPAPLGQSVTIGVRTTVLILVGEP